jgi:putative ABC transport system permease protein
MTFLDLIAISGNNLWRMKLRTFLTVSGVIIAIAAFVSMLSFGAGNQKYVAEQYNELGLFNTMQVYPVGDDDDNGSDSSKVKAVLDEAAVEILSDIPGVNLAYPFDAFTVTVSLLDTSFSCGAQSLPTKAARTRLFSRIKAGSTFTGDSTRQALVTESFLEILGIEEPDSIIGREALISVRLSSIDSGLANVLRDEDGRLRERLSDVRFDSLMRAEYRQKLIRQEMKAGIDRFLEGFMDRHVTVEDTITICGVVKTGRGRGLRTEPIIIPISTARRFTSGGISSNPSDLFSSLSRGELFSQITESEGKSFSRVTLDLDSKVPYESISDSVKALGFRSFSYAEQFAEIRRFFFYFDLILGVIGAIALITASLGIVNTMVMSIIERKREIGVIKALGADDRDIRLLFLVESGVIGASGAILGIVMGWIITRIVSAIAKAVMINEGMESVELFAIPLWLIAIAFLFGLVVSVLAGSYPARRAARVDPVVALRND